MVEQTFNNIDGKTQNLIDKFPKWKSLIEKQRETTGALWEDADEYTSTPNNELQRELTFKFNKNEIMKDGT